MDGKIEDGGFHGTRRIVEHRQIENVGRQKKALSKDEGSRVGEYTAMHDENFVTSCLTEEMEGKTEEVQETS